MRKGKQAFVTFNGAAAAAYRIDRGETALVALEGFPLEGPRKPTFRDARARSQESSGPARRAIDPKSDAEEGLERDFVETLALRLDALRKGGAFEELILAASPAALGYWRQLAPRELKAAVVKELDRDFVRHAPDALYAIAADAKLD